MSNQETLLSRRTALTLAAAGAATLALPAFAQEHHQAIKHYIMIDLAPGADQLILDRFYMTFHSQEIHRAVKAWQRNYISFRSYLPPEEAKARYPLQYGRMTEIQFSDIQDFRDSRPNNIYGAGLGSYTSPPGGWRGGALFKSVTATIPVNPQDMFVNGDTPPKEIPYLRWIQFFKYPKGVTRADGDKWYRDVHAKEVAKLRGLKRYALYQTVVETQEYPRVAELWFDDYPSWKAAFLPAPKLTPPAWGGQYPFVDMISMFIGENPDVDFISHDRVIP
jgi:hypothetical protein